MRRCDHAQVQDITVPRILTWKLVDQDCTIQHHGANASEWSYSSVWVLQRKHPHTTKKAQYKTT